MTGPSNPYRPGAGISPPVLAGRDDVLGSFGALLADVGRGGEGERPWLVTGTRGVGKTVLLLELAQRAEDAGWLVASVEAGPPDSLARALVRELYVPMHRAWSRYSAGRETQRPATPAGRALRRAVRVFSSFRLQVDTRGVFSFGVDLKPGEAEIHLSGDLGSDLFELFRALGEWLREEGRAGLLTIDELDAAAPDDIHGLNKALHLLGQEDRPVPLQVVAAGQPRLPAVLARANAYAERLYRVHTIGSLSREAAIEALARPAEHLGVTWGRAALERVLDATWNVPYFLQSVGRYAWDLHRARTIGTADAETAIALAFEEAESLFRSRWELLTGSQQALVTALARRTPGGEQADAATADLAADLGRTPSQLSRPRAELINRGVVEAPASGRLRFTLPGFAAFALRLADEEGLP